MATPVQDGTSMLDPVTGISPSVSPHVHEVLDASPVLRGNLGVISLAFTVVAFNGPMAIISGFIPIIVLRGNGLGAPLMFLLLGALVLVFAVGLNAMAGQMTKPGAFYTYITQGLGKPAGLVAGFLAIASYFMIGAGTYAMLASVIMHLVGTMPYQFGHWPWWVWAIAGWAASTLLSLFNIDLSAKVLGTLSAAEIMIAIAWNIAVFWNGGPEGRVVPVSAHLFSGSIALAVVFGVLSLTGFESLQIFRAETRNADKSVPIATYVSVAFLALLYVASSYAYIISIGKSSVLQSPMDDLTGSSLGSFARYLGQTAASTASLLLITSIFAAALAIQNISARYLYMFGREGVLPARLGIASARHGSPMFAASVSGIVNLLLFGSFAVLGIDVNETLTDYCGIGAYCLILLWVLTSFAIIVFFARARRAERMALFPTLVAPSLSALGLGAVLWVSTQHFSELLGGNVVLAHIALAALVSLIVAGLLLGYRQSRAA